ncbi:MAG: carboxylating nicotinate-nucleotide diphosphorylase [Vulcanimicrobiaceae bacterium]
MTQRPTIALEPLAPLAYESLVREALLEDLGLGGDLTSEATIPCGTVAAASIVARESGVVAGGALARAAFIMLDSGARFETLVADGARVAPGAAIATIVCDARALLAAERTALNVLGHLCGIATATARYVAAVGEARARIVETRKTLPGLRVLQKYAVRAGGGRNHRFRLDDAILIKDNHVALAGGVVPALVAARARAGHLVAVEIEVDTLDQLDAVLASPASADCILLDNFSVPDLREAVRRIDGRARAEASGGITLANVAEVAATGVDIISVGALTHSARALDLALDIDAPSS